MAVELNLNIITKTPGEGFTLLKKHKDFLTIACCL